MGAHSTRAHEALCPIWALLSEVAILHCELEAGARHPPRLSTDVRSCYVASYFAELQT